MNEVFKIALILRAYFNRFVRPGKLPFSRKFGFDRGAPIDRFWIEQFLAKNKALIVGVCLEITDSAYTKKFGTAVTKSDILDIDPKNKQATIYADLTHMPQVKSNTYDTIILTQVLGMIAEYQMVISECHRILKPGGTLIVTTSCLSPTYDQVSSFLRFTPHGLKHALSKNFSQVTIDSFGNAESGAAFWLGLSQEDLSPQVLSQVDPQFPCIAAAIAKK